MRAFLTDKKKCDGFQAPQFKERAMRESEDHPWSAWRVTGPDDGPFPVLESDRTADVVIIGGGFTGLSAAKQLFDNGVDCIVIEARDIGSGASGRTGGFAVPRYKKTFSFLAGQVGDDTTKHLFDEVKHAINEIEANVQRFQIACDFQRPGHMTPAHSQRALTELKSDVEWLHRTVGDNAAEFLDKTETAQRLGTDRYWGAYFDPRGACIQPYAYVRGLASGLAASGVPIFAHSGAEALQRDGDYWVVRTPHAQVRARRVILATNGYTQPLLPNDNLHRCIVPVASSVVTTRPLNNDEQSQILPARIPATDSYRIVNYFRILPNNQLLFGGRGDITGRRDDPAAFRTVEKQLAKTFPAAANIEIRERWSGMVAVSRESFPQVARIEDGVFCALGYAGRGVALSHLLGQRLAELAVGKTIPSDPMTSAGLRAFPFHRWRRFGMHIAAKYYRLRDQLER